MVTAVKVTAHLATIAFPWAGATVLAHGYPMVMYLAIFIGIHPLVHFLFFLPPLLLFLLFIMPLAMTARAGMAAFRVRRPGALIIPILLVTTAAAICTVLGLIYTGTFVSDAITDKTTDDRLHPIWAALASAAGTTAAAYVALTSARRTTSILNQPAPQRHPPTTAGENP